MRAAKLILVSLCAAIAGCSDLPRNIETSVADNGAHVTRMARSVGQVEPSGKNVPSVSYENGLWLSTAPIKFEKRDELPPIFGSAATFDRSVGSLSEFAERITVRSGIAVEVAPDAMVAAARATQAKSGMGTANPGAMLPPPSVNMGRVPALGMPGATAATEVRIVYPSGTLKGLLDTAASRFGVFWRYKDGAIQFFFTDTRTFQINAIPGDSALSATVASSTSGSDSNSTGATTSTGNSNNSQNIEVKSQLSVFASVEKSIQTMLSTYGKVVSSPATGSITVSDTPDSLVRIAAFIDNENKALSRQVMINVTVLAVTLSDGDNYGIDWNLVYSGLSSRYGVKNTFNSDSGGSSFSAAILATATSKLAGTSLVIQALSEQGRVRKETTASVVTLNNQPVPVQVTKQTSYLKSSQSTITANVGSSNSLIPGTVTSGFNMTILPHVLSSGTVMLQFSTDISTLRRIRVVSSNDSSIESPEVDTRNFLQRVAMRSGETLIVSGFEQVEENVDHQGVGKATNFLLGGGVKASVGKEVIVILVTPIAMAGV